MPPRRKLTFVCSIGVNRATTVDDCEVRLAHGGGVDGRYVTNNWIHNIGQLGGGATTLFENNTVEECNYANYSYSWEAGGVKVFANKEYHDEYGSLVRTYTLCGFVCACHIIMTDSHRLCVMTRSSEATPCEITLALVYGAMAVDGT